MPCTPQLRFRQPTEDECVAQGLVDYLNSAAELLNPCNPTNTVGIFRGPNPPGVDDTDVLWLRTNSANEDLYLLSYTNGRWRKLGGVPGTAAKIFYNGPISGVFDPTTGMGIVGGEWDGWIIRYDDANKFIVMAESYNGTNWLSSVTGSPLATGGTANVTSDASNTYAAPRSAVKARGWTANANAPNASDLLLYGGGPSGADITLLAADAGQTSPAAVTNVPPFIAYVLVEYIRS